MEDIPSHSSYATREGTSTNLSFPAASPTGQAVLPPPSPSVPQFIMNSRCRYMHTYLNWAAPRWPEDAFGHLPGSQRATRVTMCQTNPVPMRTQAGLSCGWVRLLVSGCSHARELVSCPCREMKRGNGMRVGPYVVATRQ